jgi:tetratricopeptide (TPR) repeat protein
METDNRVGRFSGRALRENALVSDEDMASPESEDESRPAPEEAAAEGPKSDEPAWPPAEARPEAPPADTTGASAELAAATKPEEPSPAKTEAPGSDPAAEPKQEMGLSESTLHWLVDGEQAIEPVSNEPGTAPHYDPRAPVAGRKRTVVVIGGAAIVAFVVAVVLHGQAARHRATANVPAVASAEPAAVLTQRAEAALAQGRSAEALDLANLALGSDARFADAFIVVGRVQRGAGRVPETRDAYRKYLELAPLGTHAEEARAALATLPP